VFTRITTCMWTNNIGELPITARPIDSQKFRKLAVVPNDVQTYLRGHRGPDPANLDVLCSQVATDRLVSVLKCFGRFYLYEGAYGEAITSHHGLDYNWRTTPIDPQTLYASGGKTQEGADSTYLILFYRFKYFESIMLLFVCSYLMFDNVNDSSQVRVQRAGSLRSATHSSHRSTHDTKEVERLQSLCNIKRDRGSMRNT
jgi:hypothetical protein